MSKVTALTDLGNIDTWDDARRYVTLALANISAVVNGNLAFGENIKTASISVTFTVANSEISARHGLGKAPTGFIQVGASAAIITYNGTSENTDELIYLKGSATGTVTLLVF